VKAEIARQAIDTALGSVLFTRESAAGAKASMDAFVEAAHAARDMLTEDNAAALLKALRNGTAQQMQDGVLRWRKLLPVVPGGPDFVFEDRERLVENTVLAVLELAIGKIG
jgi:hypothetical protein